MITFPLTLPADGGPSRATIRDVNTVGVTSAPFSLSEQIQEYDGQAWEFDLTFPPMDQDRGRAWVSALRALRGPVGTFYFITPNYVRRGVVPADDVTVSYGSQVGNLLVVHTSQIFLANAFRAGDFFSLGTTTGIKLYTILETVGTNSDGDANLYIWPRLRTSPAGAAPLEFASPRGLFRLVNKGVEADEDSDGNIYIAPVPIREAL